MFLLDDETQPTLLHVAAGLESGAIKQTKNNYISSVLMQQLYELQPVVTAYKDQFAQAGIDVDTQLITAFRLVELSGAKQARSIENRVEVAAATQLQKEVRSKLVSARDSMIRLAREAAVDGKLFTVNFGSARSNASRILAPAQTFASLLAQNGDELSGELGNDFLVNEIKNEVSALIQQLHEAEVVQEQGKYDGLQPTNVRVEAKYALYRILLTFSRLGFVLARHDDDEQARFSLRLLRRGTKHNAVVTDDDDAPILQAPVAGVEAPAGNVVAISA